MQQTTPRYPPPSATTLWSGPSPSTRPPLLPSPMFQPSAAVVNNAAMPMPGPPHFAPSTFLGGGFGGPHFSRGANHNYQQQQHQTYHHQQQQHQTYQQQQQQQHHHQNYQQQQQQFRFNNCRGGNRGRGRGRGGFGRGGAAAGPADPSPWHCCNRDFRSESDLVRHKAEHAKCWVASCPFTASQELIELHFVHQHRTGLASRILQADGDSWRQERRKNFPTAARAEAKQKESAAKEARGEVVQQRQFGRMSGGSRGRGGGFDSRGGGGWRSRGRGRGWGRGGGWQQEQSTAVASSDTKGPEESADADYRDPLAACLNGSSDNDEDNEENDNKKIKMASAADCSDAVEDPEADAPPTVLSSLAANYASSASSASLSEEDGGNLKEDTPAQAEQPSEEADTAVGLNSRRYRRHVDAALVLHRRRERLVQEPSMRLRRPALLEMLLARHIRHERNLLFQCVRHICANEFFDTDKPAEAEEFVEDNQEEAVELDLSDAEWDDEMMTGEEAAQSSDGDVADGHE